MLGAQQFSRALAAQARRTAARPVTRFLDITLRGAAQVFLIDNPLSGLLFIAGVAYAAPRVAVLGVLGLIVATLTAMLLGMNADEISHGLHGFNGIQLGHALAVFLGLNWTSFVLCVVGAAAAAVLFAGMQRAMSGKEAPPLTAPYILLVWLILLSAPVLKGLHPLPPPELGSLVTWALSDVVRAVLAGIGQIMFLSDPVSGVLFLAGLLVSSVHASVLAVAGALLGLAVARALGGPETWGLFGLWGFNPALCAVAMGCIFLRPSYRSYAWGLFAALCSAIAFPGLTGFMAKWDLPAMTFPFVITTWVFLWAKPLCTVFSREGRP